MSPLANPPSLGYADYQRIVNYDSQVLYGHGTTNEASPELSGILNVARYAYVGGLDYITGPDCYVRAYWWTDGVGSTLIGKRTFTLSQSITNGAQYRLLNLGPFVTFEWFSIGGANFNHQVELIATNRVYPLEFIPQNPLLVYQQGVAIGANATPFVYPTDYYAGPIRVWWYSAVATALLELDALDTSGTWDTIDQVSNIGNGVRNDYVWIAPPGAWRINITNGGVAGTYYMAVTQSTTGAA